MRLLFLIIFISNSSFCQKKSGVVFYEKHTKKQISEVKSNNNINDMIIEADKLVTYKLHFNDSCSVFKKEDKMYNDRKKLVLSKLSSAGYSGVVYRNNYDKVILRQKTTGGESFIIKYPFFDLDWKLINNTENVGNYLCYKAISVKKYKDSKGKIKEETFIAWYSPEIPVNFGPFVFGGLPGLILKLETEKEYFIANRISLKKLNNKIEKPQKGVEISLKKYDSIVMGLTKKIREN